MGATNFDSLTLSGVAMPAPDSVQALAAVHIIEETVAYTDMTDVTTTGTYDLTTTIPAGAFVLGAWLTSVTGFAGDTSATLQVGDGTDVDRYNTGTPDVFSTVATGLDLGVPSGLEYHATAATVKLTVTTNADFTSVSAGSLTIRIAYIA